MLHKLFYLPSHRNHPAGIYCAHIYVRRYGVVTESFVHAGRLLTLSVLSGVSSVLKSQAKTARGVGRRLSRMSSTCAGMTYSFEITPV